MLKINKDQKREPIGGHHVPLDGRTFQASSFPELVKKVRDYRLNNGIPIGVPDQEVLAYYKAKFAYMVVECENSDLAKRAASDEYEAWRSWIMQVWGAPPKKTITPKEAKDRWEKCKNCPMNRPFMWKESDESAQLSRRAFMLRRGIDVPDDLGFCFLHRADLSVFTFIEAAKQFSKAKDGESFPSCWVE